MLVYCAWNKVSEKKLPSPGSFCLLGLRFLNDRTSRDCSRLVFAMSGRLFPANIAVLWYSSDPELARNEGNFGTGLVGESDLAG